MFNKDFFPTPIEVIDSMGIDCQDKIVLEPSAGKGNIVEWLKMNGAKDVLSCELNKDLAEIVKTKSNFLAYDFLKLTPEKISHIDFIVMNPPFSKGVRHVLHAWNVAPDGCEIVSLINNDSLENDYSQDRRELGRLIEDYGSRISLGNCFAESERKTGVEVGLIKLYKPKGQSNEFEGFFMEEEIEEQGTGVMPFNAIRDAVNRYVAAVKCFDEFEVIQAKMNGLTNKFGVSALSCSVGRDNADIGREGFKKELQKAAWKYLFDEMNLEKFVTSGVKKDINSFVENQTKVPFTMKNVYKMFEIIVGTREQTFNRSLVEAIDKFTEHTHENRYAVEGWKTNAGHLLNQKFIVGWIFEVEWGGTYIRPRYSQYEDKVEDLNKVLCNLMAVNYDSIPNLRDHCGKIKMQTNTWYEWGFFQIKGFKKGTMHAKFKDRETWARLNQAYAKIKGQVLPEKIF